MHMRRNVTYEGLLSQSVSAVSSFNAVSDSVLTRKCLIDNKYFI